MVLDYEVDFPDAMPLELALYATGAARAPRLLLGEPQPWGSHRRPGILDVEARHYDRVLSDFAARCFDPAFVRRLHACFDRCIARLAKATTSLDAAPTELHIRAVVDALADVMAFHVLNWALPLSDMEARLAEVLGVPEEARSLLMRMLVPIEAAHLADVAALTAAAHRDMAAGDWSPQQAVDLAEQMGHLQAPGMAERPFEDPHALQGYLRTLDRADRVHLDELGRVRAVARGRLARDTTMLLLAEGSDATRLGSTWAVMALCRLAAEEEEQRRRWQSRALRVIRVAGERTGCEVNKLLPEDCEATEEQRHERAPSLLDPTDRAWAWLTS